MDSLSPEEEQIIVHKGTEPPFSGEFDDFFVPGTYHCRRCNAPLFSSDDKFDAHCGWPAFDQAIPGAVRELPDIKDKRTEIQCTNCGAHLGHVFLGEQFTTRNTRHCVNSLSMRFVNSSTIVLGGGCFWCTEAVFSQLRGVVSVVPGYAGGNTDDPTYDDVCRGDTGHAEVVQITYDEQQITLSDLLDVFFATHNPTTPNRQGADAGSQYRSLILTTNNTQAKAVSNYMVQLKKSAVYDRPLITEVKKLQRFYKAEISHQEYYSRNPDSIYCRVVINPKLDRLRQKFSSLLI